MASIPVHRVAILRPFAKLLANIGVPVEPALREAGIPPAALDNVNNYIPSYRFWSFLVNVARKQGINDLGFRVGHCFGADCADPKLTSLLRKSPTLYNGLLKSSALINKTVTNCRLGLLQPPGGNHTFFYHRPSCDASNPAIEQIGWYGLTSLLGMVRVYAGPNWRPSEIGVMTSTTPFNCIREEFRDTRMRPSQRFSYIALNNEVLSLPPINSKDAGHAPPSVDYEPFSVDFDGALKQVLTSYVEERDLSVDFAAELCNTSKRTLQRRLNERGTCYSDVRSYARFDVASRILRESDDKVTDISRFLGYSDPTHFSRAFRKIAGVTPRTYREARQRRNDPDQAPKNISGADQRGE